MEPPFVNRYSSQISSIHSNGLLELAYLFAIKSTYFCAMRRIFAGALRRNHVICLFDMPEAVNKSSRVLLILTCCGLPALVKSCLNRFSSERASEDILCLIILNKE